MKNSTRKVSMLLAVLMILGLFTAFPVMTASAATNYASGLTATVTKKADGSAITLTAGNLTYLTDGTKPAEAAGATNSIQINGSSIPYYFVYDLGSVKTDLQSVAIYANFTSNRSFDEVAYNVELSSDGTNYTAVTGSKSNAVSATNAVWTEYTYAFVGSQSGRYVRITAAAASYVLQLGEIEILNSGAVQEVASSSTEDPTLVDGNYAYGASYTLVRDNGTDVAYRNDPQADTGLTMWTDGYEGTGATGGTNYYTAAITGTSLSHTLTLNMTASHADVGYVQLKNSIFLDGNAQFQDPIMNSIKVSSDGVSYTGVTFATEVVTEANGAHTITYTFNATTAKYIELNFTPNTYVAGWDEIIVGAGYVNPDPDPDRSTASSTLINATTATNYAASAQGAYYNYVSANALPSTSYDDNTWTRVGMAFGKWGQGDLNNGVYATATYEDAAWVGWVYSSQYDTAQTVVMEFDLMKLVGNIDKIVVNSLTYGGEEDIATQQIISQITVAFGDFNGNYGTESTVVGTVTDTAFAGDGTETAKVGTAHKAEFGIAGPTTGTRYVKITLPKTLYRLFIDEIEIWGGTGYAPSPAPSEDPATSEAPTTSETPDSSTATGEDSAHPELNWESACDNSHVIDRYADFVLSAEYGTYASITDAIGTELATNFTGIKVSVTTKNLVMPWKDVQVTNADGTKEWVNQQATGVIGTNFRLFFDTTKLTPLFPDFAGLSGDTTAGTFPAPVVTFPTYTYTSRGQTYTDPSISALCKPYSMADGTTVDPSNANQIFTKPLGYIDNNYITDSNTYEGVQSQPFYGKTADDEFVYAYYFAVAEGCEGETFTFNIPCRSSYTTVNDYVPRVFTVFSSTFHDAMAHCTGPVTCTVPTAEVEPTTYTVTFKGIDGAVLDTQTVEEGAAATAPAAPAVEGKTFKGWDVAFDNITADTVVTAVYEDVMITITFAAGEGGSITGATTAEVVYGTDLSTVTFPAYAANDGYEFDAWSQTSGALTADITVTATFKLLPVEEADFFVFADGVDSTYIAVDEAAGTITFKVDDYNTIATFGPLFKDANLTYTNKSGTAMSTATSKVGTNCTVTSTINGQTCTLTVILFGDVDGNGAVNMADYMKVKNAVSAGNTTTAFTGNYATAANVVGPTNPTINLGDYMKIKNFVTGSVSNF